LTFFGIICVYIYFKKMKIENMGVYESYVCRKTIDFKGSTGKLAHNPTGELIKHLSNQFRINCKNVSLN